MKWHILFEALLVIDCVLPFHAAYYDKKNALVCSWKRIAIRYARGTLLMNVVSSIPIDSIVCFAHGRAHGVLTEALLLPRVVGSIRIQHVFWLFRSFRLGRELWQWVTFSRYSHLLRILGQSVETTTTDQEIYTSIAILVGSLVLAIVFGSVAAPAQDGGCTRDHEEAGPAA
jgi:hypothetical protein